MLKIAILFTLFDRTSPNFNLAFGKKFNEYYRLEVSAGYTSTRYKRKYRDHNLLDHQNKIYNIHEVCGVNAQKYLINNFLDSPKIYNHFMPYLMAGIGLSYIQYYENILAIRPDNTMITGQFKTLPAYRFAYQFGIGINIDLIKNFSLDLSIRRLDLGRTTNLINKKTGHTFNTTVKDTIAFAGLTYQF